MTRDKDCQEGYECISRIIPAGKCLATICANKDFDAANTHESPSATWPVFGGQLNPAASSW